MPMTAELLWWLDFMMLGSRSKAVHACMIRLLNFWDPPNMKVAIYVVNQRISNVYRIAGVALQRSTRHQLGAKDLDPNIIFM